MMRPLAAVLFALALLLSMAGCEDALSEENYQRITVGMDLSQVESILGKGTQEDTGGASISGAGVIGGSSTGSIRTYSWKEGNRRIIIDFRDSKVHSPPRKMGF